MTKKYEDFSDIVGKVALWTSRDFPEVEQEDLFQDLMLWVLKTDSVQSVDAPWLVTALSREAKRLAWDYRKRGLYLSVQYHYRPSDVRKILETAFDDYAQRTFVPEDAKSMMQDDQLVINGDIKRAYSHLPEQYQTAIFNRYFVQANPETDAEKKRLQRAIDRLVDILNNYHYEPHEGLGSRKVISNANANARIQDLDG